MAEETKTKQQVREFYDQVGWQTVEGGLYQNAHYEDLRPVSQEYIHRCHLRVGKHLVPKGRYLLDAGSGPIQYEEYLSYSQGFEYRVCADISIQALKEARKRIGNHGLFVVADVSNLPFKKECFEGIVSLHTLHHLAIEDQFRAYLDLYRVLTPGKSAVIVNGWTDSPLGKKLEGLIRLMEKGWLIYSRLRRRKPIATSDASEKLVGKGERESTPATIPPIGTFVKKMNVKMLKERLNDQMEFEIWVWRSVSVHFLRSVIHPALGGWYWLRLLFWLEERFPHYFGEKGQYPLIVIRKG
jgi:ubiquinone/menaquinone biosynthesis C-methylase UbiE